ncbi:hypothetical protein F5Y16DRAFT_370222 [Xylariaceae sp. FL0255]|nr:hypothetical protein F5Y16DRAFT_370222 [Xylariaceae sp. FL0255]
MWRASSSSAFSSQPSIRALTLLLLITTLYAIYGYWNFYRDPLSIFFSEAHGFDRFYSATRQAEADSFLDDLFVNLHNSNNPHFNPNGSPESRLQQHVRLAATKAGPDPQICAVFLTIGREMAGRQYVETAVGSFLSNMTLAERRAIHLKLFFADVPSPQTQHVSYDRLVSLDVADDVVTYESLLSADKGRGDDGSRKSRGTESNMAKLESWAVQKTDKYALERKAVHDYAYALRSCYETTSAPYIAVFEGDILLADGWASRTLRDLHTAEEMMRSPTRLPKPTKGRIAPGEPSSWLYVRMFNQERSTGWGGGTGFRSNNVHIISLAVSIPLAALLTLARRTKILPRQLSRHLDSWTILVITVLAVPLFTWLFFASGKASLLGSPSPGVYEEWFGCCNQALVYNRQHALGLSDFLLKAATDERKTRAGRTDMLPKDYAWDHGLARLSAYPMLAQHNGRISAIDTSRDEARRVWSMAFEDLRAERLAWEHVRNVREVFGDEALREMIPGA